MASDSSGLIMRIFSFYAVIFVVFGLVGSSFVANDTIGFAEDPSFSLASVTSSIGYFFSGIGFVVTGFPWYINLIIFLPLTLALLYIFIQIVIQAFDAIIPG